VQIAWLVRHRARRIRFRAGLDFGVKRFAAFPAAAIER
jgi:hypothetical protein